MALVSIFRPTSHLPSKLCSPRSVAFWMAHLALSVALATMVLAMSSTMVAMATGRRWGVGLGSSENTVSTYVVPVPWLAICGAWRFHFCYRCVFLH